MKQLCTRILGACSVIQGALPKLLLETPKEWFDENVTAIQVNRESLLTESLHFQSYIFHVNVAIRESKSNFKVWYDQKNGSMLVLIFAFDLKFTKFTKLTRQTFWYLKSVSSSKISFFG